MTTETNVPKYNIHTKCTFASDAMYKAVLGLEAVVTINELGTDAYKVMQVDQFTIVLETEDGRYLLVSKSAIIAIEAPDTAVPAFHEAVVDGVKQIQYKASKPRTDNNKSKFKPRPQFQRTQYTPEPAVARQVEVIVKPKRSY